MGQTSSRLKNHNIFLEEQSRTLHWSAEVLARTDENIDAENSFLLDYDADSIASKVENWIRREIVDDNDDRWTDVDVAKFSNELKHKMSKSYESAYEDLRRFGERVDKLAEKQRRIHKKLLDLDPSNTKKLIRLKIKVFKNLRITEKMLFQDRRLRTRFIRKVYDIDHECFQLCREKFR